MMNYVIGGIVGIIVWQGITTIVCIVSDENEELTMGFGTGVWYLLILCIGLFLKLIKFDFKEHDFQKVYKSFKRNYKKPNFNYEQWKKANGKHSYISFNKLVHTPEYQEFFRGEKI